MEFKRLSDVTLVTEVEDTANVLVEVGGEIKKVNKKEVGGAGGYVMVLNESNFAFMGTNECTANYDEMYDVLMEGGTVWLDFSFLNENSAAPMAAAGISPSTYGTTRVTPICWALTDVGIMMMVLLGEIMTVYFTNGSHNLTPTDS